MNIYELIERRQSNRAYDSSRKIEKDKIERILEAARLAPSACNSQPWHFIVVDEPELKNKVADCTSSKVLGMNHFTKQAPVHIVVVQESVNFMSGVGGIIKDKQFAPIDIGIATSYITLAAVEEGLGSCIVGWINEPKLRKLLSIPKTKRILLDIVVGYPSDKQREKKRKNISDICSQNNYK